MYLCLSVKLPPPLLTPVLTWFTAHRGCWGHSPALTSNILWSLQI